MDNNYKEKYVKYKTKYLNLKTALAKSSKTEISPEEKEAKKEYKKYLKEYTMKVKQIKKYLKQIKDKQVPNVSYFTKHAYDELTKYFNNTSQLASAEQTNQYIDERQKNMNQIFRIIKDSMEIQAEENQKILEELFKLHSRYQFLMQDRFIKYERLKNKRELNTK